MTIMDWYWKWNKSELEKQNKPNQANKPRNKTIFLMFMEHGPIQCLFVESENHIGHLIKLNFISGSYRKLFLCRFVDSFFTVLAQKDPSYYKHKNAAS